MSTGRGFEQRVPTGAHPYEAGRPRAGSRSRGCKPRIDRSSVPVLYVLLDAGTGHASLAAGTARGQVCGQVAVMNGGEEKQSANRGHTRRRLKRRRVANGGEAFRLNRTQDVAGSSPASSTNERARRRGLLCFLTRNDLVSWSRFGHVASLTHSPAMNFLPSGAEDYERLHR